MASCESASKLVFSALPVFELACPLLHLYPIVSNTSIIKHVPYRSSAFCPTTTPSTKTSERQLILTASHFVFGPHVVFGVGFRLRGQIGPTFVLGAEFRLRGCISSSGPNLGLRADFRLRAEFLLRGRILTSGPNFPPVLDKCWGRCNARLQL